MMIRPVAPAARNLGWRSRSAGLTEAAESLR
jgi:hypothetical protein